MKKAIVTGANGFIGSALLRILSVNHVKTYAIVRDRQSLVEQIKGLPDVHIVYCKLEQIHTLPELIQDRDIDVCIHLAWGGSFGDARANYDLQLLNIKYALDTVNAIERMNIKRFVGAGTLAEKDVLNYHPIDGVRPNKTSIYGIAKISAHFMTKALCASLNLEHIWCQLSNTYGVGNTTNNFVNMACNLMLSGKRAAFTAGEQTYDFMYITDTARAIFFASEKGKNNVTYYLGSGRERKLKEYICLIRDAIDPQIELYLGELPFHGKVLPQEAYQASKLAEDTGFFPLVTFEEGIKWTVEWLKMEQKKQITNM